MTEPTAAASNEDLDIHLSQSTPYHFFNPGSSVSGNVVYKGNAREFKVVIEFEGKNTSRIIHNNSELDGQPEVFQDEAMLFAYSQTLHSGPYMQSKAQMKTERTMSWYFKFRFPSTSESRRTVYYKNVIGDPWTNTVHALPPSFEIDTAGDDLMLPGYDTQVDSMSRKGITSSCSIDYNLKATILIPDQVASQAHTTLLFMPFSPGMNLSSIPQGLYVRSGSLPFIDNRVSVESQIPGSAIQKAVQIVSIPGINVFVRPPSEVVNGKSFRIEVLIASARSEEMEYSDHAHLAVRLQGLVLECTTFWRANHNSLDHGGAETAETHDRYLQKVALGAREVESALISKPSQMKTCMFEATIPSRISPSFTSFLVHYSHLLKGVLVVTTRDHRFQESFECPVQVCSAMQPPLLGRKLTSLPLFTTSADNRITFSTDRRYSSQV